MNTLVARIIIFVCLFCALLGQNNSATAEVPRFAVGLGAGILELWHASGRVSLGQKIQIGIRLSTFTINGDKVKIITGDIQQHFGSRPNGNRPPWFMNLGLSYMTDENDTRRDEDICLPAGIGREFLISRHLGFQFDAGVWIRLRHKEIQKGPEPGGFWKLDLDIPVLPLVRFQVFSCW
jgi:hypothetical protein